MKATIRDAETLRTLPPLGVASYLRSKGWRQVQVVDRRGSVWASERPELADFEILLPLSRDLGDFVTRMAEVIGTLEVAEGREQLQILGDIADATADVVRIQIDGPVVEDGTLPIDAGVEAFEKARDLMLAAACAAVQPRAVYHTRRPTPATEYMTRLRLGQTAHGSFVMTVRSPVPPALHGPARLLGFEAEEPFEREVTKTLARALAATRNASEIAAVTADLRPFTEAVHRGVSANLCEAIVGLSRHTRAESVTVSVAWSPAREVDQDVPSRVQFSADAVPVIAEAARVFREAAPREEFELHGVVVGLNLDDYAGVTAADEQAAERVETHVCDLREIDLDELAFILRNTEPPGSPLRCYFPEEMVEAAKDALDKRVRVTGSRAVKEGRQTRPLAVSRLEILEGR